MTTYRMLGTNDEQTTCLQCGKKGLKRVVWLEALDSDGNPDGDPIHVGTSCAALMLCGDKTAKSKNHVTLYAQWAGKAQRALNEGHSFDNVVAWVRRLSGLAFDTEGETIRFWSRTDRNRAGEIIATATRPKF